MWSKRFNKLGPTWSNYPSPATNSYVRATHPERQEHGARTVRTVADRLQAVAAPAKELLSSKGSLAQWGPPWYHPPKKWDGSYISFIPTLDDFRRIG